METAELSFQVVIPARFASSRLPGKPLREIGGRPMVLHTVDRALESGAAAVLVATDDPRILQTVQADGQKALMTSAEHETGTDRLAEVARLQGWSDQTIVVNLQGDEPFTHGALLRSVAEALHAHPDAGIATVATPLSLARDVFDPNVVKVVCDDRGLALYFSRAPLPWVRDRYGPSGQDLPASTAPPAATLRHVGLYAYRVGTLRTLSSLPPHPLERAESLEQLRALAAGIRIHVTQISEPPGHGVDTEEDLARAEAYLAAMAPHPAPDK